MADQVAGVLRHARAAFLVSVLLFSVIVYHHSSMQTGYSEGLEAVREALKNVTIQSSNILAAGSATVGGSGLRRNGAGARHGASSRGGSSAARRARLRRDTSGGAAAGSGALERGAGGERRGGRPKGRKLTPAQRRAQRGAQAALSTRVCGSPAEDGYKRVNASCLRASPTALWWQAAKGQLAERSFLEAHVEDNADYDGVAVKWGLGNKAASAQACAQACLEHVPAVQVPEGAVSVQDLPCNAFSWCGDAGGCFEPDIHRHEFRDCWLKFTEAPLAPEVNMRGNLSEEYRARHPRAPVTVQWATGVLLPEPLRPSNGSWSPRLAW